MGKLPIFKPSQVVKIVEKQGFIKDRQSGSHAVFIHPDGRRTTIPIHNKDIGKGLLRKILRDIKLSPDEIINL